MNPVQEMIKLSQNLSDKLRPLTFQEPVSHTYNPLDYAWANYRAYLEMGAQHSPHTLWLGMNPGPWGMTQSGVPFGEVSYVKDWLKINHPIEKPADQHPKRPIEGFNCQRSEVSGRRVWGLMKERFKTPQAFFKKHLIVAYCPLVFMEHSGRNRTPDKLSAKERATLYPICDEALQETTKILDVKQVIAIGQFAEKRARDVLGKSAKITKILHPSPASPAANRGWAQAVDRTLTKMGLW